MAGPRPGHDRCGKGTVSSAREGPRVCGKTIFALNLARGRRYRIMNVLELQALRRKGTPHMIGSGIRKRGKTAVEDLHQREVQTTTSGLQFVGQDFEGLVMDGVWSDKLLTSAELAALQGRCVVELFDDHDPDNINRDVWAEFVHHAKQWPLQHQSRRTS